MAAGFRRFNLAHEGADCTREIHSAGGQLFVVCKGHGLAMTLDEVIAGLPVDVTKASMKTIPNWKAREYGWIEDDN